MEPRNTSSELGFLTEKLIDAWFEYLRRRSLTRIVIASLLRPRIISLPSFGVVGIMLTVVCEIGVESNDWLAAICSKVPDLTNADFYLILLFFVPIFLGLVLYFIEKARAKIDLPDIDFEPNRSFFEPECHPGDPKEAKYIDHRPFYITAHFMVKTGHKKVALCRVAMIAYDRGITCLGFRKQFYLGSEQILPYYSDPALYDDRSKSETYTHDGNYEFNPPITIEELGVINFSVRRKFSGPFPDQGAPIDFVNAELKLIVKYVVDGETKEATFNYSTNYSNPKRFARIETISDIPYFSNREINFLQRRGKMTIEERDSLLSVDPELRIRAMEGGYTKSMEVFNQYGVLPKTFELMQRLWSEYSTLPRYNPEAIWQTRRGKAVKWVLDYLSPKTKF